MAAMRQGLGVLGTAALIWALAGCGEPLDNTGDKPYNVLLFTIDTLRADHLGAYGYEAVETPNIDRLASEGVLFQRAYSPCPVTLPSHTSILTGAYPPYHGVRNNGIFQARESLTTLAEVLKGSGYATGAVVGAYVLDASYGLDQGFDEYEDTIKPGQGVESEFFYPERKAAEVNRHAMDFIRRNTDRPFFLWVHYFDPHSLYNPPMPFAARYAEAPYDGEIAYVDQQVGALLKFLRMKELAENTLVVLTSDHGEGLKEHDEDSHGVLLYNTTLHVPLIFFNPELIRGPAKIAAPVSLVDIMPTLLDILNIDPGAGAKDIQGKSLVPLMTGRAEGVHDLLYFETLLPYFDFGWAGLRGILQDDLKYISSSDPEIYDLAGDPGERRNLLPEKKPAVKQLEAALDRTAQRLSHEGESAAREIDQTERARLGALGYTSGGVHTRIAGDPFQGTNPRGRIWVQTAINEAAFMFHQGKYVEGIEALEALLEEEPGNPNIYFFLGILCGEMGRLDDAARYYRALIDLQPSHEMAANNLGVIYNRQGKTEEAAEAFRKALTAHPDHPDAICNLAIIQYQRGEKEKAEENLKRAIALRPYFANALNNLGALYADRGDYRLAAETFEKALMADPELGEAALNCGRCYYLLEDKEKAARYLYLAKRMGKYVEGGILEELKAYR